MKPIDEFLPRLAPYIAGCPTPMMRQALLDSAVAFCEDSMALRQRLDTVMQPAGLGEVDLDLPAQQGVARLLAVWANGVKLVTIAAEDAPERGTSGAPTGYYTRRNDSEFQLILHPTPDQPCGVNVEVALRPLYGATQVEDDLFNLWMPAIIAGAMARLLAIPDQPFSNLSLVPMYAAEFTRLTAKARSEGAYGRVRSNLRVQMRPFA